MSVLTGQMFVGGEVLLDVSLDVARVRLASQVRSGSLLTASQDAYAVGFGALPGDGLPGSGLALSRLVEVKVREPVRHGDSMVAALRWEAIGPHGELFPVLDANLTLVPAGVESTMLRLAAAYRPPPDAVGARLDRPALDRVAAATVWEFVSRVGTAITSPAPATGDQRPDAEAS
jgi:hypothetical protein